MLQCFYVLQNEDVKNSLNGCHSEVKVAFAFCRRRRLQLFRSTSRCQLSNIMELQVATRILVDAARRTKLLSEAYAVRQASLAKPGDIAGWQIARLLREAVTNVDADLAEVALQKYWAEVKAAAGPVEECA